MAIPLVLVTGLPASGKSAVSAALSSVLTLPVLSVDTVKEAMVDHVDVEDRLAVRSAARAVVAALVPACPRGCIIDIWVNPLRDADEVRALVCGIPVDIDLLEVVCRVPAEVALERYAGRVRHAAHLPADEGTIRRIQEAAPRIAPLGLGPAYDLDTTGAIDVTGAVEWLRGQGV